MLMWKMQGKMKLSADPVSEPVKPIKRSKCGTQTASSSVPRMNPRRTINIFERVL